jgi:hypothetical protein
VLALIVFTLTLPMIFVIASFLPEVFRSEGERLKAKVWTLESKNL